MLGVSDIFTTLGMGEEIHGNPYPRKRKTCKYYSYTVLVPTGAVYFTGFNLYWRDNPPLCYSFSPYT